MKLSLGTLVLVAAVCVSGCSWIRGACATAMPVITAAQTYESDAQLTLRQIEQIAATLPIDDAAKAKILAALSDCEVALKGIDGALLAASSACSAPDINTLFAEFVTAWTELEPLIVMVFGKTAMPQTQKPRMPLSLTPLIVQKARGL